MFVVVTQKQIKLYEIKTGFMQILHNDIFDDENSSIQTFKLNKSNRKCYLSSDKGVSLVLNI